MYTETVTVLGAGGAGSGSGWGAGAGAGAGEASGAEALSDAEASAEAAGLPAPPAAASAESAAGALEGSDAEDAALPDAWSFFWDSPLAFWSTESDDWTAARSSVEDGAEPSQPVAYPTPATTAQRATAHATTPATTALPRRRFCGAGADEIPSAPSAPTCSDEAASDGSSETAPPSPRGVEGATRASRRSGSACVRSSPSLRSAVFVRVSSLMPAQPYPRSEGTRRSRARRAAAVPAAKAHAARAAAPAAVAAALSPVLASGFLSEEGVLPAVP